MEEIASNEQLLEALHTCEAVEGFIAKAFCEGGVVMYIIAFVGLLVVFLCIERMIALKRLIVDQRKLEQSVFALISSGNLKGAINVCSGQSAALPNVMKAGLVQVFNGRDDEEVQVAMDAEVLRQTPRLEGWSNFLAVLGNMAVLVGLLGTVSGLIRSFGGIANVDSATKSILLSKGIAEALNCTSFGLLVAIIAIFIYGIFQTVIGRAINSLLESSMTMMNLVVSNRNKLTS